MRTTIEAAAAELRAGGLVAFPTETVYGLGANALDAAAVERIFERKKRPKTSPLIVHVASLEAARALAREWPATAEALARRYWPGPLTLIVQKCAAIPDIVTAGLPTVGLRMPAHPAALELLRAAGVPVAAPSANAFTELSPTMAEHVRLGDDLPVLDGGACAVGIESTVLSLAGYPRLLRPGAISLAELEARIGPIESGGTAVPEGAHESPGQHLRHYRPRTRLFFADGEFPAGRGAWLYRREVRPGAEPVRMPDDPAGYAAGIYAILHDLDGRGLDWIAVEPLPESAEWAGVADRLTRAAGEA